MRRESLGVIDVRAAKHVIELPSHVQQAVANNFRLHSAGLKPPVVAVLRID